MQRSELYRCDGGDIWQRQTGNLNPIRFARKIGGCEDLVKRLELYGTLDGHDSCVNTVHFNPTGTLLVSGSDDRDIVIWDWAAKSKVLSYNSGHINNVFQARIMPFSDDRSLVSCAADGQVRHSQILENGKVETKRLAKHRGRVHKLAIEPGSPRTFYSCAEDGVVRHFDLRDNKSTKLFTCLSVHGSGKSRMTSLNAIVINPRNPNYFAVGGSDAYARVYDIRRVDGDASKNEDRPVQSFAPKHLIGDEMVHITCVAYSEQEELLVSYNDELIYLFEKGTGLGPDPAPGGDSDAVNSAPQVFEGHRNERTVKGVSFFGPHSEYVVSGSDCGRIFIWKKRGGQVVAMLKGDKKVVNCLEPHPTATFLATSGIESNIKIWAPTADRLQPLPADAETIMHRNQRRREAEKEWRRKFIVRAGYRWDNPNNDDDDDDEEDMSDYNCSDDDFSDEGSFLPLWLDLVS